jgi:PleD family two-component response regulator
MDPRPAGPCAAALPNADLLIKATDDALYLAESRGRDSLEVWQPLAA